MGGDIGIAGVTTLLARRAQIHQQDLAAHTSAFDPAFETQLKAVTRALLHAGATAQQAAREALGELGQAVLRQAQTLAYIDTIWLFAVLTAAMVPLAFFTPAH
jgi:DHA2 family multidrug resistance protein